MPEYRDQTGQMIVLESIPRRIVSLVPSQTELLHDLGLAQEVVGITKFCIHPDDWFRSKTRVGGTKQLKMEIIRELQPDLIIANKEENVKEQIVQLAQEFPVWISDVNNLDDALEMIKQIGLMTGKKESSEILIQRIKNEFSQPAGSEGVRSPSDRQVRLQIPNSRLRTIYLIWQNPYMTIGGDTFIHSMMVAAGFDNLFKDRIRYPELSIEDMQRLGCQLLLLSSEPFPFKQKHVDQLQALLPQTRIKLVDGEMFSWYGSRLLRAPGYFQELRETLKQSGTT